MRLATLIVFATCLVSFAPFARAQADLDTSSALTVAGDRDGLVLCDLPRKKMQLTPFVVFIRQRGADFDIIARGKVETIQDRKIIITIDKDSIEKFPLKGDLAVALGTPADWPKDTDDALINPPLMQTEEIDERDPAYMQFDGGLFYGRLDTTASDNTSNMFKQIPVYRPFLYHFIYYTDFFWHFGLEYESWSGNFPTSAYNHKSGISSDSTTILTMNYRFKVRNRIRPILRISTLSSDFKTFNYDEAILNTSVQGLGFGGRVNYEFDDLLWQSQRKWDFKLIYLYGCVDYFPSISGADGSSGATRGTALTGSIIDARFGASASFYARPVPLIHRFIVDGGIRVRQTSMVFSGLTTDDPSGAYVIPVGTKSKEMQAMVFVTVGLRFDDFIGKFMKPR